MAISSLNFEVIRSKIFYKKPQGKWETFVRWFAHFMVGLITGTVAFIMVVIEENLTDYHSDVT